MTLTLMVFKVVLGVEGAVAVLARPLGLESSVLALAAFLMDFELVST